MTSELLNGLAKGIWLWCRKQNIFLSAQHVRGIENVTAGFKSRIFNDTNEWMLNQRLPGACNRSPGSKLLSITTQLHCGCYLGGRAQLPDTILEEDHPMTIPSKFGFN